MIRVSGNAEVAVLSNRNEKDRGIILNADQNIFYALSSYHEASQLPFGKAVIGDTARPFNARNRYGMVIDHNVSMGANGQKAFSFLAHGGWYVGISYGLYGEKVQQALGWVNWHCDKVFIVPGENRGQTYIVGQKSRGGIPPEIQLMTLSEAKTQFEVVKELEIVLPEVSPFTKVIPSVEDLMRSGYPNQLNEVVKMDYVGSLVDSLYSNIEKSNREAPFIKRPEEMMMRGMIATAAVPFQFITQDPEGRMVIVRSGQVRSNKSVGTEEHIDPVLDIVIRRDVKTVEFDTPILAVYVEGVGIRYEESIPKLVEFVEENIKELEDQFMARVTPLYTDNDFEWFHSRLSGIRLGPKMSPMTNMQIEISASAALGLRKMKRVVLAADPGMGKTGMALATAFLGVQNGLKGKAARAKSREFYITPGELVLVVAPPQVAGEDNWKLEASRMFGKEGHTMVIVREYEDMKIVQRNLAETKAAFDRIKANGLTVEEALAIAEESGFTEELYSPAFRVNFALIAETRFKAENPKIAAFAKRKIRYGGGFEEELLTPSGGQPLMKTSKEFMLAKDLVSRRKSVPTETWFNPFKGESYEAPDITTPTLYARRDSNERFLGNHAMIQEALERYNRSNKEFLPQSMRVKKRFRIRPNEYVTIAETEKRNDFHIAMDKARDIRRHTDRFGYEACWQVGKGNRPMSLAEYITRTTTIGLLIADEYHEYQGQSARAEAVEKAANSAKRTLGLTGSIFNGKSSSMFPMAWAALESVRKEYGDWRNADEMSAWIADMGAVEHTQTTYFDALGNVTKQEESKQEIPGATPKLIGTTASCTIFATMNEAQAQRERPIIMTQQEVRIPMDNEERELYLAAAEALRAEVDGISNKQGAAYATVLALTNMPSTWYMPRDVYASMTVDTNVADQRRIPPEWQLAQANPEMDIDRWHVKGPGRYSGQFVITKRMLQIPSIGDRLSSKERWLIRLVRGNLEEGRGVMIGVEETSNGLIERLKDILSAEFGAKLVYALPKNSVASKRQGELDKQYRNGVRILIGQIRALSTGLNIQWAPTTVVYQKGSSLQRLVQFINRANRISNDKFDIRIYHPTSVMETRGGVRGIPTVEAVRQAYMSMKLKAFSKMVGTGIPEGIMQGDDMDPLDVLYNAVVMEEEDQIVLEEYPEESWFAQQHVPQAMEVIEQEVTVTGIHQIDTPTYLEYSDDFEFTMDEAPEEDPWREENRVYEYSLMLRWMMTNDRRAEAIKFSRLLKADKTVWEEAKKLGGNIDASFATGKKGHNLWFARWLIRRRNEPGFGEV